MPVFRSFALPWRVVDPRILGILALGGVSLAAVASAASAPPRPYTLVATEACLKRLPDAVVGLPPATPPVRPALFIYSFRRDRLPSRALGKLGAWRGHRQDPTYEGMTLSFFKTTHDARASAKSLVWLYGGKLRRNIVVAWDQSSVPRGSLRTTVLACLRVERAGGGTPAAKLSTPQANLATFAGHWGGHTRGLRITLSGRGLERADSGCCVRVYQMTFQILSVSGMVTRATAAYRVTSFKRYAPNTARLRVGQVGKLLLRQGIVTNTLTGDYFCSDPAWGATGACGA
jgi:hypothetical protein